MIGRQVIPVNTPLSLEDLYHLMEKGWKTDEFGSFLLDRPTAASIEKYVILSGTEHFCVIAYARKAGGLFSRQNKVILTVCENERGAKARFFESIPTNNAITGAVKIGKTISLDKERKGPAEDILQVYTAAMKALLKENGLTSEQ